LDKVGSWDSMRESVDFVRRYNENIQLNTGVQPAAFIHSYGCQQNVSDGEKMSGMLSAMGYDFCDSPNEADIVIYNTCAVRGNAEGKIYGNAGALKHVKARRPEMILALCGCMMQQAAVAEKIKKSYPYIDLVFGPSAMPALPKMIHEKIITGERVFTVIDETAEIAEDLPIKRDGKYKAWVPIMHGCNNFCTYCVVPFVRGRERSRDSKNILGEIKELAADGFKEITLLGQNVNSYKSGDTGFVELIRMINEIPGDFRVRFMTSHPKDCSRELIDAIAECGKICNHLHLPFQSGSDRILKLMNRGYTVESYLDIINYAREKIPDITFTSDVIVGFPGEEYSDVQKTIELIKKIRFQSLYTFIYSKRSGTKAAEMQDNVSDETKHEWFSELLEIQNNISREKFRELIGTHAVVLAELGAKSGEGYITGKNVSNVTVDFKGAEELAGKFVNVKITQALNWALLGEIE